MLQKMQQNQVILGEQMPYDQQFVEVMGNAFISDRVPPQKAM